MFHAQLACIAELQGLPFLVTLFGMDLADGFPAVQYQRFGQAAQAQSRHCHH